MQCGSHPHRTSEPADLDRCSLAACPSVQERYRPEKVLSVLVFVFVAQRTALTRHENYRRNPQQSKHPRSHSRYRVHFALQSTSHRTPLTTALVLSSRNRCVNQLRSLPPVEQATRFQLVIKVPSRGRCS